MEETKPVSAMKGLKSLAKKTIRRVATPFLTRIHDWISSPSYTSEEFFFERIRKSVYDDRKFLEQDLRRSAHQIDKMLTLDKVRRMDRLAGKIDNTIDRLEGLGIVDSPTVIWAKEVIDTYRRRLDGRATGAPTSNEGRATAEASATEITDGLYLLSPRGSRRARGCLISSGARKL